MAKRVAIIGAGASGLTSIKACLEEGLEPVCYERSHDIGGLWRYTKVVTDSQACVSKDTVINTSKEMMSFSDFPVPGEFPVFMHNSKVLQYFRMYVDQFDLFRHIRFRTDVLRISRADDFRQSGKWNVEIRENDGGKVTTETFDAVMLCVGHHAKENKPRFEGDDVFGGKILHSHDYRDGSDFSGKTVVVVGLGNSGGDAAVELSRIAKQVYLSSRRGSWLVGRLSKGGTPTDMVVTTRFAQFMAGFMSPASFNNMVERQINEKIDHSMFGLRPENRFGSQHLLVNDDLPGRILCGSVVMKPNVTRFTKTGVEFEDGTVVNDVDVILLATGYIIQFPFLEEGIIQVDKNEVNLFKYVFPPDLEHPTLSVIGCVQPIGSTVPIAEMHARWATRVFKGECQLPSVDNMKADIWKKKELMETRYVKSQRHTIQVDFLPYMDEIAALVGCKPNIFKLYLRDRQVAKEVLFGPATAYQYRLEGPGKWEGSRDAILHQWERLKQPLKTRQPASAPPGSGGCGGGRLKKLVVVVALAAFVKWYCGW